MATITCPKSTSLSTTYHQPLLNNNNNNNNASNLETTSKSISSYFNSQPTANSTTFLHSQKLRQNLLESRKAFLSLSLSHQQSSDVVSAAVKDSYEEDDEEHSQIMEEKSVLEVDEQQRTNRVVPLKKISFKIKKTSSIYRRNAAVSHQKVTISANTVAELTKKFNQIIMENKAIIEESKFRKKILVKRVNSIKNANLNSQTSDDNNPASGSTTTSTKKVSRKPSFTTKINRRPSFKTDKNLVILKTAPKPKQTKNASTASGTNKNSDKMCVRAKIGYLEAPHSVPQPIQEDPPQLPPKRPTTLDLSQSAVKQAIEIFERKSSPVENYPKMKPKVPERTFIISNRKIIKKSDPLIGNFENQDSRKVVLMEKILEKDKPKIEDNNKLILEENLEIFDENDKNFEANNKIFNENKIVEANNEILLANNKFFDAQIMEEEIKTDETDPETVQIINIPAILPQRRCDSMYETLQMKKIINDVTIPKSKSEEVISTTSSSSTSNIKPNSSFLWRFNNQSPSNPYKSIESTIEESIYDTVESTNNNNNKNSFQVPEVPKIQKVSESEDFLNSSSQSEYETVEVKTNKIDQEDQTDDGYEYFESPVNPKSENIYETLPRYPDSPKNPDVPNQLESLPTLPPRKQAEPLPPRPPSLTSYCTIQNSEVSNCYESIYHPDLINSNRLDTESNYESIYGVHIREGGSNRDSYVSSDQHSNSLYGRFGENGLIYSGKATSDLSSSDRSDEWVDVTDNDEDGNLKNSEIIIVREKQKSKKSGWAQHFRDQWLKSPRKFPAEMGVDSDSDHHYESLYMAHDHDDDYDSFDSDSESDRSFSKVNLNDSGVDIANNQLPEPPNNQPYVLTRIAATAGKHMRKLRRNWSLTKNDISKSLSRMTKRKSRTDLSVPKTNSGSQQKINSQSQNNLTETEENNRKSYQNVDFPQSSPLPTESPTEEKSKTLKKGFLNKFRRSMSMSAESANELTSSLGKPKSTFYLTETIDVDLEIEKAEEVSPDSGISLSPVPKHSRNSIARPQSPPPPVPRKNRSSSWYAEAGLFKNNEIQNQKRPNTFWYAEVGLYQGGGRSTPSTSSAENSGTNVVSTENYYNMKNHNFEAEKNEENHLLRLQDEPLYQFYDAAVLESVCYDGTSDFDSDGYEEVGKNAELSQSVRPTAMELISPKRNSFAFVRTLWCEIPEVIQSSVLSTLSTHQKKLQEAKFEILTSEASYLNSLNVLMDHFIVGLRNCDIGNEEWEILFGNIEAVKDCSERLLLDLEKCWQENILLHGICDIVQKHADENFHVYIPYCENQIQLDETLKRIKERPGFADTLRQLENSATCQSLSLYSFLMLPMQRITRWPLLIDAVLKRLSQQDFEYLTCQYVLATLNKIVSQCNESARQKERENEMRKIASQLEFPAGFATAIEIASNPNRWLIRSGIVTHMQQRTDEAKLTFGKRFVKSPLHLFLFNDMLVITKAKNDNSFTVLHYCPKSLVEINTSDSIISLPIKDSQGRHLIFLTILENQEEKTVEFLLSCNSESDKERWIEALSPPKSEDPDETLYECWDCPQVTAIHNYLASQPDELAVVRGDVINVLRKMVDGWYHGERIRDGQTGWFPANYTVEIANPHVRARNLKQRYRLLAFSENYLKDKKLN